MSACLQVYTDVKQLRYGHLMIMTDQDHDGSHIKGLIMNYFHTFYPSLMKLAGFLIEFITPVIKVDLISASHSTVMLCHQTDLSYSQTVICRCITGVHVVQLDCAMSYSTSLEYM